MIAGFEFATAGRIVFGTGTAERLPALVQELGGRILLVTGAGHSRHGAVLAALASDIAAHVVVAGEPDVDAVAAGARAAVEARADVVVGLGGGSAIDAAKAVAALAANPGDPFEHLEVVGRGRPLAHDPLPVVAVPTTSGTGAEVTRNAVLGVPRHRVKVSLRSPRMLPRVAVVDPLLALGQPPAVAAASGMDALTQLLEPFVCRRANPLVDAFCREGLARVGKALPRVATAPGDVGARTDMALCSLLGGLALANAGLGAVHGFAGPLGGMYPAPHGALCAALAAPATRANLRALRLREPGSPALARYDEAARLLVGGDNATADDLVRWLAALARELGIPPLSAHGIAPGAFPEIVAKASQASSMAANPVALSAGELAAVLDEACGG